MPTRANGNGPPQIQPISVRIPQAVAMTGFSRSRIYELIASGELQIAKDRRCTLILVASLKAAVERRLVRDPASAAPYDPAAERG
jgi:hypothetical protein